MEFGFGGKRGVRSAECQENEKCTKIGVRKKKSLQNEMYGK